MDKEFIGIILGIIGLLATGASSGMSSKLWSLIVAAVGCVALGFSFTCLEHPFAGGLIMGGIIIWGTSFIFTKIKGEDVLTGINWLTCIVGTLIAILGGWILYKTGFFN